MGWGRGWGVAGGVAGAWCVSILVCALEALASRRPRLISLHSMNTPIAPLLFPIHFPSFLLLSFNSIPFPPLDGPQKLSLNTGLYLSVFPKHLPQNLCAFCKIHLNTLTRVLRKG